MNPVLNDPEIQAALKALTLKAIAYLDSHAEGDYSKGGSLNLDHDKRLLELLAILHGLPVTQRVVEQIKIS